MMRINYVTLLWILAQLLHPLIWMFYWDVFMEISGISGLMVLTLFFSLPAFFIGVLTFSKIMHLRLPVFTKFIFFLVVIESCILLTGFLFCLFLSEPGFVTDIIFFSCPACISVVLAF